MNKYAYHKTSIKHRPPKMPGSSRNTDFSEYCEKQNSSLTTHLSAQIRPKN